MMRIVSPVMRLIAIVLVGLVFLLVLNVATAQGGTRQLTHSGDVMEFVWSGDGKALYVTRQGDMVRLDASTQQVRGDLYRIDLGDGSSERIAQNVNMARAARTGSAVAFVRLNDDGRANLLVREEGTGQSRRVGALEWGVAPEWSRAGETLFVGATGQLMRAQGNGQVEPLNTPAIPKGARLSPLGDRYAYVNGSGLVVTQGTQAETIAPVVAGMAILPQFVWSNAGDELAYVVEREGSAPELWVADTVAHTTRKIAAGEGLEHFANFAWSPEDAYVIFTRTPSGSSGANQSEIWRARADGSVTKRLTINQSEETLPQYAPDGSAMAFMRDGDVWVVELDGEGVPLPIADTSQVPALDFKTPRAVDAQRTPPATIRVRHDAANACRSAPVGQIETIDFETYVKRVVPAEVFSTWDAEALKSQAVAARSYAWFWILQHTGEVFDVTDTTAYQYMCDTRAASTDAATDDTRGQYLDYQGNMVFAAFGAENGDPTLTNSWGNPYLLGVDDPVSFMKTRAGNGIGLGQWGAQRWATQYDWNYQQILTHYYSNVTVQAPASGGGDSTPPVGAMVLPWNNWGEVSNRMRLRVNASDDNSGIEHISLAAQYLANDGPHTDVIAKLYGNERDFVWDVSALPNQSGIQITPILYDVKGNAAAGGVVNVNLDRAVPQGSMTAPATTTSQNITLNLSASDDGGAGLAGMAFSNDWEWQGEAQQIEPNTAIVVNDAEAVNGKALRGVPGTNPAGAWFGPYTDVLPRNRAYRAWFRIKVDNNTTPSEVALLDVVTDGGANILGMKRVYGTDLRGSIAYQEFYVDFYYPGFTTNALEFRVAYRATATLWLDRILVTSVPVTYAGRTTWTLSDGTGSKRVVGKFVDGVGNVSADATATVVLGQSPPTLTPREWLPFLLNEK